MIEWENICEDLNYKSFFLPKLSKIDNEKLHVILEEGVDLSINPFPKEGVFVEGNLEIIFATIPINIFANPNVIENVHICAKCSPKEISIYTSIFKEFHDVFS